MRSLVISAFLVSFLSSSAFAQTKGKQYRDITLIDGRQFVGEILATAGTGLEVMTRQGKALVSFEVLKNIVPSDSAAFEAQKPVTLVVTISGKDTLVLLELAKEIPNTIVVKSGEEGGLITPELASKAKACDSDVFCVADAVSGAPFRMVVGWTGSDSEPIFVGKVAGSPERERVSTEDRSAKSTWVALHEVLGLVAQDLPSSLDAPTKPKRQPKNSSLTQFDEARVNKLSFVPLPGFPSMKQGDGGNAGLAWAVVLPTTGAIFGVALSAEEDNMAQTLGLTAAGFYVSTVFSNQLFGMSSLKKRKLTTGMVVMPNANGGADVTVQGRF